MTAFTSMSQTRNNFKRNSLLVIAAAAVIVGVVVVAAGGSHRGKAAGGSSHLAPTRINASSQLAVAADYLGLSRPQLRKRLRTDGTLVAVAHSTPGRSRAGLIEALVKARMRALTSAAAAGSLSSAKLSTRLARLRERVEAQVQRVHGQRQRAQR
jgi:hypothetical protein